MPSFDQQKAYAVQEDVYFDDGREEKLLDFIKNKPSLEHSPAAILAAIDEYARTQKYLMNVGEDKGKIVCALISQRKPETMIELGGYVGYSTILFADAVRSSGGKKYYSLEKSPKFANIIEAVVKLAGLDDIVEVIVGSGDEGIKKLNSERGIKSIDMMFLDHIKPAYTPDLKLAESLGMIVKGTVLAADNVVKPGNPPYLKYVRSSVKEKREALTQQSEGDIKGNPDLIYESKFIESWEPSGVPDALEVTTCLGEETK